MHYERLGEASRSQGPISVSSFEIEEPYVRSSGRRQLGITCCGSRWRTHWVYAGVALALVAVISLVVWKPPQLPAHAIPFIFGPSDPGVVGTGNTLLDGPDAMKETPHPAGKALAGDLGNNIQRVGKVISATPKGKNSIIVDFEEGVKLRATFWRKTVLRIELAWNSDFEDPVEEIVVGKPADDLTTRYSDVDECIWFEVDGGVRLRISKSDNALVSLFRAGEEEPVLEELEALGRNGSATFQALKTTEHEQFVGGGMQNGKLYHRGKTIRIAKSFNWDAGGSPNAAPIYMSSRGYGVFRNTWAYGTYDFRVSPQLLAHEEQRFDAFYMISEKRDVKNLLEQYTYITGRPYMPPVYALGLGDSDCYHNSRHNNDTRVAVAVAQRYAELDVPLSWMLVNDGYGCGYGTGPAENPRDIDVLIEVSNKLQELGVVTGLWASQAFSDLPQEVAKAHIKVLKTDVAWVGQGGRFAFAALQEITKDVKDNSESRPFIWTVEGWAGTQRMATMWTGDNRGDWVSTKWQVTTVASCGFSAQAHVSGDIDGIFDGSPESMTRDLQWKTFTTAFMSMGGWSHSNPDKQPYSWGQPYTMINREFLYLKMKLTPYYYTLSSIAHSTGVPPVRPMAMEFPEDDFLLEESDGSELQFMAGPYLLVAPVVLPLKESLVREGIYLPRGLWVDIWTGNIHEGPQKMAGHPVNLATIPVFAASGAILPKWPRMRYPGQRPLDSMTFVIYPGGKSSFELYEDDGMTRAFESGAFATTLVNCSAPEQVMIDGGSVTVNVGATSGEYDGQLEERSYIFQLLLRKAPTSVVVKQGVEPLMLEQLNSHSSFEWATGGWFWDPVKYPNELPELYEYQGGNRNERSSQHDCFENGCPRWRREGLFIKVHSRIRSILSIEIA